MTDETADFLNALDREDKDRDEREENIRKAKKEIEELAEHTGGCACHFNPPCTYCEKLWEILNKYNLQPNDVEK